MLAEDVAQLAESCKKVPPATGVYEYDDFITNLLLTVIDYQLQTTAVERAMEHYTRHAFNRVRTLDDLDALMSTLPDDEEGNRTLARFLWGYDLWTRASQLRALAAFCHEIGAEDHGSLRRWAFSADFASDFQGRVKGLGIAVFNWLVIRLGVDTAKPDVQVRRFVEGCVGKRVDSDQELVALVAGAATMLGKSVRELDWSIWEHMRAKPRSAAVEPRTDVPAPATPDAAGATRRSEDPSLYHNDEVGYAGWLRQHPSGFVVNCAPKPRATYIVVHRATCPTISGKPTRGSTFTTLYMKVCSDSITVLSEWAQAETSGEPTRCGRCKP